MTDSPPAPLLVTDFDGTIARRDFYDLVRQELMPPGTPDFWGMFLAGRLTHFQALAEIFLRIRQSEAEVLALAARMEVDPAFGPAVRRLRAAGWQVVVASAGCAWYIERLLADAGVTVTLHANPGAFVEGRGLVMRLPEDSPYVTPSTGIDKAALMADLRMRHPVIAFAGDGPPDLPPALMVPPARRFARAWLADALRERGEGFHPFEPWEEIADRLLDRGDR
ncbi:MAG TPA: HAD-IB family phosphatase [Armatimonadota bacterium]|nr:HAD-IB family phosphatase [Armatimonadota bacterium]